MAKSRKIKNINIGENPQHEEINPTHIPQKEDEPLFVPEQFPGEAPSDPNDPVIPDFVPDEMPGEAPVETPIEVPVGHLVDTGFDIGPAKYEEIKPSVIPGSPRKKEKELVYASDNAYPNGELEQIIDQQREDTSEWQNHENHSPNANNPDHIVARVFTSSNHNVEGAKVLLQEGKNQIVGKIIVDAEEGFLVEWRNGQRSIEKKANYELVVVKTNRQ